MNLKSRISRLVVAFLFLIGMMTPTVIYSVWVDNGMVDSKLLGLIISILWFGYLLIGSFLSKSDDLQLLHIFLWPLVNRKRLV